MDKPVIALNSTWRRLTAVERVQCVVGGLLLSLPLLVAWFLTPDLRGHGTHEQLGLPPCTTMQWLGIPCVFCGMTTSVAWFAHGHPVQAFVVQPAAAILAAVLVGSSALALAGALWGWVPAIRWPHYTTRAARVSVAILVLGWMYKFAITVVQ